MLKNFFERRRIKKLFGSLIAPDAVNSILRDEKFDASLTEGLLQFAFPYLRGTQLQFYCIEFRSRLGSADSLGFWRGGGANQVNGAKKATSPNAARALRFQIEFDGRGIGESQRWAA